MLRQPTLFTALLIAVLVLWQVLRRSFVKSASSFGRAGFVAAMMAGILISAWAIGFSPVIPAAAVPSRWSDFSFWSTLMEDIAKQAKLSRSAPDLPQTQVQCSVLFYSGAALIGFVIGVLWRCKSTTHGKNPQPL